MFLKHLLPVLLAVRVAGAADWPQFMGPARNGVSPETNVLSAWPKEGPKVLWKAKVGEGWSGPVVVGDRTLIFHREDEREVLDCLDRTNGVRLWRGGYPATYRDDFGFEAGPRATPAVDGNRVFTFGADGVLSAWDLATGTNQWRVDTRRQLRSEKGFFGIACSPLVEGGAVILNIGGADGAGIVAFDKTSGRVQWKATSEEASYSSPVAATVDGQRRLFVFGRKNLVALTPTDGRVIWEFPWAPRIQASVSAAVPLIVGEYVFISASYGAGAALLRFRETRPLVVWSGDDILSAHYASAVVHGRHLYGFDGRQEQRCRLRCVELASGKVRWSEERFGSGAIIVAGRQLLILTERGELVLAPASPDQFTPVARAQILGSDIRAHPALANGVFYARDKQSLIAVEVSRP